MSASPRENAEVSLHERKKITVNAHALFIDSLLSPADHDEIDELLEDIRAGEFEEKGAAL